MVCGLHDVDFGNDLSSKTLLSDWIAPDNYHSVSPGLSIQYRLAMERISEHP